jgi:hypothetical protein
MQLIGAISEFILFYATAAKAGLRVAGPWFHAQWLNDAPRVPTEWTPLFQCREPDIACAVDQVGAHHGAESSPAGCWSLC